MSSRDEILASIRANRPRVERPLPDVPLFDDEPPASLLAAFKDKPCSAWAGCFSIRRHPATCWRRCGRRSLTPRSCARWCRRSRAIAISPAIGAPRDLADVDFAIVRASFAVAETGSVLLSETDLRVNAVAYLAQHLIVLLDPADIVVNLHHAYRRPEFRDRPLRLLPHRPVRDGRYRRRAHPRRAGRALARGHTARAGSALPRLRSSNATVTV